MSPVTFGECFFFLLIFFYLSFFVNSFDFSFRRLYKFIYFYKWTSISFSFNFSLHFFGLTVCVFVRKDFETLKILIHIPLNNGI